MSEIRNRLEKNFKRLAPWAERNRIEAFRLYDRDLPDYPFLVDKYGDYLVIYDRRIEHIDSDEKKRGHLEALMQGLAVLFAPVAPDDFLRDKIIFKRRERQTAEARYGKLSDESLTLTVRETQARFLVNLTDYLDTGLFLDHRLMRQKVFALAGPGRRVLNLFAYTGTVSVFAALKGAHVTTVDMSAPYTRWAEENFRLNDLDPGDHNFVVENALEYLARQTREKFDIVFLDPPTFSNSKKMAGTFEVERDQLPIIEGAMTRLREGGLLLFSNNKRSFRLSPEVQARWDVRDITASTIPKDIHDQKIHAAFEIRTKSVTGTEGP